MSGRCVTCITLVLMLAVTSTALGDVTLPAIFGDHMVLQLGQKLPFWGQAEPGEEITVTITSLDEDASKNPSVSTTAAANGHWQVKMPARSKSGEVTVTVAAKNTITFSNVLIGEVWLCSGQSNMEWPVNASLNHQEEISEAKFPTIRLFKVERSTARHPQTDIEGHWVECSPETVGETSAVAYFFGRELQRQLKRPIGLIEAAYGGASCEAWISQASLASEEDFSKILERAERSGDDPNQANNPNRATVLHNGIIAPLQPFAIKGVIWYQGESNAQRAFQYRKLFPLLIADWRRGWGQGDFPFLFVQLANYVSEKSKPDHPLEPEESAWAELREAQLKALSVPKTGMAVTIDIGEPRDIHPKNKQDVGHRLALSALRVAYNQDIVATGPEFKTMKISGHEISLEFQNVGTGLFVHGELLKGFAISGADRKFVWAQARVEGNHVVVWANDLKNPVAVRYAWGDNPECNLFNQAGLPASPFRTDDWPGITIQNK